MGRKFRSKQPLRHQDHFTHRHIPALRNQIIEIKHPNNETQQQTRGVLQLFLENVAQRRRPKAVELEASVRQEGRWWAKPEEMLRGFPVHTARIAATVRLGAFNWFWLLPLAETTHGMHSCCLGSRVLMHLTGVI